MKKGTWIAFVITLVYCLSGTYVAMTMKVNYKGGHDSTYSELVELLFLPGSILGFFGLHLFGTTALIIGQIVSFIILFFITKIVINSIIKIHKKRKT